MLVCSDDPQEYGLEAIMACFKSYEKEVVAILRDLLNGRPLLRQDNKCYFAKGITTSSTRYYSFQKLIDP